MDWKGRGGAVALTVRQAGGVVVDLGHNKLVF